LTSESGDSARAQLIKTRRGTWIDKSLLPAAREECLEILQAASEAVSEDIIKMVRGDRRYREEDPSLDERYYAFGHRALVWHGLWSLFAELVGEYVLPEEVKAWSLACEASDSAGMCGCCGRELYAGVPAYFGAEVYVGIWPLPPSYSTKPQVCAPEYVRTVLCRSCAPEWLSPERDDVVTQLCAHCEGAMVSRLEHSALRNTFCSDHCNLTYQDQLRREKKAEANQRRREKRAEERKKVCEVCGETFTATRRDAKTCSDGCKQKAYRQRKAEVQQDR
jgi:Zn-finger nucleic acid-binding protein